MSEGKKCEEEEKKQMKNDRDEKLISITCCLLVDCYGIELREPLERGNRALIYIGHAEPLYSILMNESDQFQRAVRLIFTECTRFCVVIARFFFLDCTRISRITCWICIRFLDLAVRLSHKNINGLFTNLRHRTGSSTTIPFRIAYASAYQRDLEAMANLHSILIPDSWCCWRLPISFLANIESNRDQEIELSLLRTSIECSNWPIKFKSVA